MAEYRVASSEVDPGYELWSHIRSIYRTALKRLNARLAEEKVSYSQYSVLLAIGRHGPMQMNRLGEYMLVAPANVTGLIDRMVKKGYVTRTRDKTDRRVWIIDSTERGSRLFKSVSARFRRYASNLSSDLNPEELAVTNAALTKMQRKVEELKAL